MACTLADIAAVTGGAWATTPAPAARTQRVGGVTIDSRTVTPGDVFVALRGERADGRDFIGAALGAGAAMAVAEPRAGWAPAEPERVLLVEDARAALAALASAHRRGLRAGGVVAVTGSVGKTTTCRLLDAALAAGLVGRASPRSYNNDLGVPLTILSAAPTDDYLVCEVGASAPGEIARLGALVRPDVAVITAVGRAHVEGFGSVEAIACEKASLVGALAPGGAAFIADGFGLLDAAVAALGVTPHRVGRTDRADTRIERVDMTELARTDGVTCRVGSRVTLADGGVFEAPVVGDALAVNVGLAVAAARRAGLDDAAIARGLARADPAPMRFEIVTIAGVFVVNDAYNANPESMASSLEAFGRVAPAGAPRVVVLADMLELGGEEGAAHAEVVRRALAVPGLARLVLIGARFSRAVSSAGREARVEVIEEATDEALAGVSASLRAGDAVLLKGSRGMRVERVVSALASRSSGAPGTESPTMGSAPGAG